ncbi:hypothetical protein LIER_14661 [Lithospermum erythrorhizon]|uniref:Uncharacterized protein n=1 Tax=Lithospermum erythrorhizon TaxID=34254 RepID=A0AAV3Q4K5_LITER
MTDKSASDVGEDVPEGDGVDVSHADTVTKAEDDVPEEAKESVPEEVRPSVVQLAVDDEWLSEHEPQGDNADEEVQESDVEDMVDVITKRRKATSKLKLNENRTRLANKRVPKNVVAVSTANMALNSKEEQAKWRFVANRRVAAEKMLSEVTKKNANIIGILEGAGVMPTVEAVGPYYPQLVRDFVCNMTEDIDDPASPNFQKSSLARKSMLEARMRILNGDNDTEDEPFVSDSGVEATQA